MTAIIINVEVGRGDLKCITERAKKKRIELWVHCLCWLEAEVSNLTFNKIEPPFFHCETKQLWNEQQRSLFQLRHHYRTFDFFFSFTKQTEKKTTTTDTRTTFDRTKNKHTRIKSEVKLQTEFLCKKSRVLVCPVNNNGIITVGCFSR